MFGAAVTRALLCASLLGGLLVGACGDDAEAASEGVRVSGVVRDAHTGEGLSGVEVALVTDVLDESAAKTGKRGGFALSVSSVSDHGRLIATKRGYESRAVSVYFDSDEVQVDIELTAK